MVSIFEQLEPLNNRSVQAKIQGAAEPSDGPVEALTP
jgi:hypothetical protein